MAKIHKQGVGCRNQHFVFFMGNKDEVCKLLGHSVVLDLCLSKTVYSWID